MLATTFTDSVHTPLAAMLPPLKLMLPAPAVAVRLPPQLVLVDGVGATTSPDGRLSVSATWVSATLLGLTMVTVRREVCWRSTVDGENAFDTSGAWRTVSVAWAAVLLGLASAVCTAPAGIVFWKLPLSLVMTFSASVQLPLAGIVPPASDTSMPPGVADTVPPQVLASTGAAATVSSLGMTSVMVTAVSACGLSLLSVMVRRETCPADTVAGAKALAARAGANEEFTAVTWRPGVGPDGPSAS